MPAQLADDIGITFSDPGRRSTSSHREQSGDHRRLDTLRTFDACIRGASQRRLCPAPVAANVAANRCGGALASAADEHDPWRHSGRKLRGRVAPDRGFGGWGCPGPLALTGVGDQLTGALSRTQSTHKPRVFDKNQTSLHASSHWTLPARIRDHAAASINHRIAGLYFDKGCWWRELPSANASSFQQGLSNDRACAAAFPQIAAF